MLGRALRHRSVLCYLRPISLESFCPKFHHIGSLCEFFFGGKYRNFSP
jgi:hypothetical protein